MPVRRTRLGTMASPLRRPRAPRGGRVSRLVVVCLAVGLPTVRSDNYFLGDDFGLVQHLHDLPVERLVSYFVSDWTEGIYGVVLDELRPLLAFTYWLDARLFGPINVSGYHATNLVLHLLNALLVLAIARSDRPRRAGIRAAGRLALRAHAEPCRADRLDQRPGRFARLVVLSGGVPLLRPVPSRESSGLAVRGAADLHVRVVRQAVARDVSAAHPGVRSARTEVRGLPGGRWQARLVAARAVLPASGAYLALRHTLFGNAVREDLLTAAAIEEFFYRQNRYVRELLPAPNSAPRAMQASRRGPDRCCARRVRALAVRCDGRRMRTSWARLRFFGAAWYVHHDRTHGRDLSLRQASLHHDRRSEHRAGVADPARRPGGRRAVGRGLEWRWPER